jgi:hypothetical protein
VAIAKARAAKDPTRQQSKQLLVRLDKARREEDVKAAWAKCFDLEYDTTQDHDLYTPQVLFEFKLQRNFDQPAQRAATLAQLLYYVRRLKLDGTAKGIPSHFCLADRATAVLGEVADWRGLYTDAHGRYDWDLRPSSPDPLLVAAVQAHERFGSMRVYHLAQPEESVFVVEHLGRLFSPQTRLDFGDRKAVTEDNFEDVYAYWNGVFGESVANGYKPSRYFVADIQQGRSRLIAEEGRVHFQVGNEEVRIKRILAREYEQFWTLYEKVTDPAVMRGIVAKIDRLTEDVARRKQGEFFTPLPFARKALEYVEREVGARWWEDGRTRLWDMAAGTGNLQYHLPAAALPHCYLSTLYPEDVEHCTRLFPGATVFQYDYLNDDVGNVFEGDHRADAPRLDFGGRRTWKLPQRLRDELQNPEIRWIVLINPPFATAQKGGATGANKADVSMTQVRQVMHERSLGETSRELFAQFLFRIRREFAGRSAWLGLFSTLKYVNATNDQRLRDAVFRYEFRRGFIFSSANFDGPSRGSQFPVGFLIWNLARQMSLEDQTIEVDVFDKSVQKTGRKHLPSAHRDRFLSKWIDRPRTEAVFPPFSQAITVKSNGPDIRDRIASGFIGSLMCAGNDVQHSGMTALFSGPYASAGGHSITPANFEQALVVHAVRLLPKAEWHNDRDQFMQPAAEPLPAAFVDDCVVWSLYANSNNTAALRDVRYEERDWQVPNQFFPLLAGVVSRWTVADSDIALQLARAEDRFVARWLAGRPRLSAEAQAVLRAAEPVWRLYFEHLNRLRLPKFRSALADAELAAAEMSALKQAHDGLKAKLLPQLAPLGFIG